MSKWISVEDRLPDTNRVVLTYCEGLARQGNAHCIASLHNGFWFIGQGLTLSLTAHQFKPIYWCELPELPKEGE